METWAASVKRDLEAAGYTIVKNGDGWWELKNGPSVELSNRFLGMLLKEAAECVGL